MNGVFTGREIRLLMIDAAFTKTITDTQLAAWCAFVDVTTNVLEKDITEDWIEEIDRLIFALQSMGCPTVSSKMHLLFKHKEKCEPYIGILLLLL